MRSTIFRQYDSRWGSLGYPTKGSSFAENGCGCCACTHLIIEKDKYKNYTPKNVRPYMVEQGFAINGQGTTWDGITKTLKYYGFDVVKPNIASDMDAAWKELNKGNRAGVLLFRPGTRGGVTWTSGGHYVAFTAYKVVNGKHYFYTKDSGARKNDGWHCYEDHMKYLLPQMWIVKLPAKTTSVKYTAGKTYTLQDNMKVRTGAGTNYRQKKRSELTADGKKHSLNQTDAVLKKGTKVTCQKVITSGSAVWLKIPSGYVCAKDGNDIYIK